MHDVQCRIEFLSGLTMDECLSFSFVHLFGIEWIMVFLTKLILTRHPISAHCRIPTSSFSYNNIVIIIIIHSILKHDVTYFDLLYAIFLEEKTNLQKRLGMVDTTPARVGLKDTMT